ncbi:Acg family FMN-binding oxidoreductase [Streptomyces sp. NPDC001100]
METVSAQVDHAAHHLVRAAVSAPSVHNTQPWLFVGRDTDLDVYADPTRRLLLTDPDGREQLISGGAALFNVRVAMRHLGFQPVVQLLPTPWNPAHLARVGWGPYARPSTDENLMYRALWQRHTHRGPFQQSPLPQPLIGELREHARAEGAALYTVESRVARRQLAELVRSAEAVHRNDPGHIAELVHWTRGAQDRRPDGVPLDVCVRPPDHTGLVGRDFLGLTRTLPDVPEVWPPETGLTLVLTTRHDTREDWLRAGQALQRVLLHATTRWAVAAFHTQPLEVPRLRTQVRTTLTRGEFPQMILRLGHAPRSRPTPRRGPDTVLSAE